jgi:hypothetical protein
MANRRFIDFPIAASVGDNDIVLIWQDGLNKQTTKATLFAGSPNSLAGLTDVDISALANGQILQYNSTTSKWENVDRTDIDLDQLGDVTIVSPTNGQVLVYNSSTSKWENSSAGFVPYTGAVTTVNLGAQSILAGSFVKAGGTSAQFLKADGSVDSTAYGTGSVTSVGLTMPSAFSVANSPVTTAGTLAVTGAGTVAQYVRGDGSLATFPALTGFVPYTGATADVNLGTHDLTAERGTFQNNGSSDTLTVNHTSGSGYGIIVTKGGNNEALYVSKTSGSGNAMTVIGGRTSLVDLALSSVTNTAGDFLTLSGGVVHKRTAAEVRTDIGAGTVTSVAALTLGTSGTDLSSTVANGTTTPVITLNVPTASATNRGALSSADWSTFNNKQNALTNPVTGTGSAGQVAYWSSGSAITGESNLFWDATNNRLGIGTNNPSSQLLVVGDSGQLTGNYRYHAQFVQDQTTARGIGLGFKSDEQLGIIFGESSGSASSIGFITYSGSAWNERMRITSAGNLGIGASIPSGQLHLKGSSGLTNFGTQMLQVESSTDNFSGIVFSGTNGSNAAIRSEGASTMTFWTGSGTSYTKQITIISTGNVGIGTGSPNTGKLVVKSGESNSTGIVLERGDNTDKLVNIFSETADGKISISSGANTRVFLDSVGSSYFTGGNVLIGTNTDAGFKVLVNSGNITNGGTAKPALAVRSGGTTYLDFYQGWNSSIAGQSILGTTLVSSDDLAFASAGTERLRIDLNGASIFRGSVATPHTTKSANYTLTATDFTVGFDCASNRTANLPDATTCAGRIYVIYQYNTNNGARYVTLDGSGSQTIDGVTTYSLAYFEDFSSVMIQSNGSNWIVIADKLYPPVT